MNGKTIKNEVYYKLLNLLSTRSDMSQRQLAKKTNVSLGMANFCISELSKKGLIKMKNFKNSQNKLKYAYILTPEGLEEKAKITFDFLKRKIKEYENLKVEIEELKEIINNKKL